MQHSRGFSRREFLKTTGAAVSLPFISTSRVPAAAGRTGASERLTLGVIGVGGMGGGHLRNLIEFRKQGAVNIAAVCDVDEKRLATAVEIAGPGVEPYRDYRYVLGRKDIDAVVIATPDHWHAVQTVHACEAGKHVFVEKPTSVTMEEGQAMVAAVKRHRRVVQVGTQARSARPAHDACTYIRNGMLGRVHRVTCWHRPPPRDRKTGADTPVPANLDWDLWLGPLPWRPHNTAYYHGKFRQIMDSGGGMIRDRGVHVFSLIRWCLDADGQSPVSVEATGTPPLEGLYDCPVEMEVIYTFKNPDWQVVWAQPGDRHSNYPERNRDFGLVFWGDKDNLIVDRDGTRYEAAEKARNFKVPSGGVDVYRADKHKDYNMNHKEDWLEAIKTGKKPCMDIEAGHLATTMCILGNISYLLGRKLHWDSEAQQVIGDEQANRLLGKPQRHPYHL